MSPTFPPAQQPPRPQLDWTMWTIVIVVVLLLIVLVLGVLYTYAH